MSDEIDSMIDRVRGLRRGREPLYITCNNVFYESVDEMSDEARTALEDMGRALLETEEHPVEPVTGMEFPLPVVGFLAVAGETLRAENPSDQRGTRLDGDDLVDETLAWTASFDDRR